MSLEGQVSAATELSEDRLLFTSTAMHPLAAFEGLLEPRNLRILNFENTVHSVINS